MKKRNIFKIVVIIISGFCLVLGFIYALFMFLLLKEKIEVVDTNRFLEIINKYDCRVESALDSDNYKSDNYYVTVDGSCPVKISYRVFSNSKDKNNFYNDLLEEMDESDSGLSSSAEINLFDYNYQFDSISGKNYQAVIKNDNTVLYVSVDSDSKDVAIDILKDLGYYYQPNTDALILFLIPGISFIVLIGTSIWLIVPSLKKKQF